MQVCLTENIQSACGQIMKEMHRGQQKSDAIRLLYRRYIFSAAEMAYCLQHGWSNGEEDLTQMGRLCKCQVKVLLLQKLRTGSVSRSLS